MFPDRWLPACFSILPEAFTEQNKLMNSTMKMVRVRVTERYASELDFLHTPAGKSDMQTEKNIAQLKHWYGDR
ncbi:hypothetical protein DSECCO2_559920 [anaerobic digester metagenome]